MLRPLRKLYEATEINMGAIPVMQAFPQEDLDLFNPFLLLHHHISEVRPGSNVKDIGVGPHPHRGFSPVTFIYEGDVNHRDSRENNEIVEAGGVQWMDAGMGIIHSERPSKAFAERGGKQEIIQLWVNTPTKFKMNQPAYYPLREKDIPVIETEGVKIKIVAGKYMHTKGAHQPFSEMIILQVEMQKQSSCELIIPRFFNLGIYNLDQPVYINDVLMREKYFAHMQKEGYEISLRSVAKTRLLVLAGVPIIEKIAMYGPFVMNTQSEIMEAIYDYQKGKMGMLFDE